MRPRGIVLITKGLLARIKAIGLSTIGMLDELITVRKGGQPYNYKDFFFPIKGIKQFALELIYVVVGKKEIKLQLMIQLKGIVKVRNRYCYALKGISAKELLNTLKVTGYKAYEFERLRDFIGISKPRSLIEELFISGIKQCNLNTEELIIARKKLDFNRNIEFKGTRQKNLKYSHLVKGKKDIKNILTALDMNK